MNLARVIAILALFVVTPGVATRAEPEGRARTQARWDQTHGSRLIINVADILTPSQREIINSGFTTFSVFSVGETSDSNGKPSPFFRLSCTVKYDTWEDRYDVHKLDPPPLASETVKDYKSWSSMCLEIIIDDPKVLAEFENNGEISGMLNIRQSTPEEGAKIKNWLVKQQSGFMQGLYAHMLGNFQYQHRSPIRIVIPKPSPVKSSQRATQ